APALQVQPETPPPAPVDPLAWESDPAAAEFELPVTRLLKPLPKETVEDNRKEIEERSRIIEDTLGQFGLKVEVVDVVCGPTITRYEVRPAPGVRVDRVSTYEHDLQMSLRAKSLRIISPSPGKDVLGIEVPNLHRRAVPFRGIAESPEWKAAEQRMGIPMLLGKDIDGSPVIADLAKMPHLIVAGATGSGKSVGLNSILSGILLCRTPAQVRLILVDPKMVEFTPYADIPHLVVPVITEAPKVAVALQWAIKEMNRRLLLFKNVGVRNIIAYNSRPQERQASLFGDDPDMAEEAESAPPAHIPYIVIVVDEMSDLMMLAGGDVEPRIVRLAQLARAVGIHLVIATQRPDVKTITGKIKANFPARLAFKVVSQVDSITILNSAGAETLIGNGDMLFMNPTSAAGAARAQGCWIDDDEIAALTGWYRDQGPPVYVPEIKEKLDRVKVKDSSGDDIKGIEDPGAPEDSSVPRTGEEADLARALAVIVSSGRATISWVQRQLKVGYNRAARIIEELEERGCIGPANGTAPREILRTTLGPPPGAEELLDDGDDPDDGAADADDGAFV
ncbi:MAG: DNA translocase FtsK, partial [Kiritimatiellae bacterium]|nr:DNA translocase FtsK [Kiritimatiellia bacterium]